jgi:hypothetical protein
MKNIKHSLINISNLSIVLVDLSKGSQCSISSASASATEKTTLQYFIIRTEFLKLASCINYTSFLGRCIHYGDVANLKNVYQCDSFSNWICSHLHKFYDSVNYKSLEKVKDKNFCKTKSKRLYSSNENKLDIWLHEKLSLRRLWQYCSLSWWSLYDGV